MDRLKKWLIRTVLLGTVKKAAEGGYGSRAKAIYWWLAGKKTWAGVIVATVAYGLQTATSAGVCGQECGDAAGWLLYGLAPLLISAGVLDEALRAEPPKSQ